MEETTRHTDTSVMNVGHDVDVYAVVLLFALLSYARVK
jgi:hypothetical protein